MARSVSVSRLSSVSVPVAVPFAGPLPSLPNLPRARRATRPGVCSCGCAQPTRGGRFLPGHDARLLAWALRVAAGVVAALPAPHDAAADVAAGLLAKHEAGLAERRAQRTSAATEHDAE